MTRIVCGVDVSSRTLDAHLGNTEMQKQFTNTPSGIEALAAFCREHRVDLVAMEATGGYEQKALHGLSAKGVSVAILNPRSVRQFAQSMGRLRRSVNTCHLASERS